MFKNHITVLVVFACIMSRIPTAFHFSVLHTQSSLYVFQPQRASDLFLGIKSNTIALRRASLCRDFITCFGNDGRVLADAGLVAEAADVFAEHSEGILVPHDQVRHSAAGPAVVLIDREPLLMPRETEKEGG